MASRHCVSARALTAALLLGCASPVTAQVRALVLGIDVNCPPGLAECWGVGIREGVARMPEIATVAQEADGDAQTATIHPQDGRLISLEALERHVASIQMGARLRAVEAVIDGWLERQEGRPVLRMGNSDEPLPLAPLTEKAQFDRRKGRAFSATDRERDAHQSLLATWSGERQPVRIVGPLRASAPDGSLSIEVREVFPFSTTPLPGALFVLGLRVNSPYGLGERWSELRECLLRFPAIEHVADTPAGDSSTVTIRTRDGQIPDLPALNAHLHSAALGAEATGIEATVEGRLTRWQGRLALKISGSDQPLPLAGLVSKIQWDHRQQHAMPASLMERNACDRLAGRSTFLSPRMRVTGPVVRTPDGQWALLEVREFDPAGGRFASCGHEARCHTTCARGGTGRRHPARRLGPRFLGSQHGTGCGRLQPVPQRAPQGTICEIESLAADIQRVPRRPIPDRHRRSLRSDRRGLGRQ
jgi:hypothetical protein